MRHRRVDYISKIDVTAYIGVLLALVWTFMFLYTGPIMHGISPDPPKVKNVVRFPGAIREDALHLYVMREGSIYFDSQRISPEALTVRLVRIPRGVERRVYIHADARARYGVVRESIAAIQAAGIENVGFITGYERASYALW
jgi:biopolymer transport protein TolR